MSEHLHPEVHPDADSLSAFVEGVLPEHERAQCLEHLAECSRCREIVFLAQSIPVAVPAGRRWLRPMLAAAAVVCVTLLGAWLYLRTRTGAPPRALVAKMTQPPSSTPVDPAEPAETPASPKPAVRKAIPLAARRSQPEPKAVEPPPAPVTTPEPLTTPEPVRTPSPPPAPRVITPPLPEPPSVVVQKDAAPVEASSGISGTVTDPTGAVIPKAAVQLRQLEGNTTTTARTDQAGKFKFAGLAPGQYELQITSPGFRSASQRVEVKAQEVAAVTSSLQVGSSAQTVEVSAAASTVQTEVSTRSRRKLAAPPEPRPLPSKLPVETTVTHDKVMLAVDSAGALFYSGNSGKSWKAVKPQWSGKIVDLITPPDVPERGSAQFQLTTDSGADWLSRDGRRWYPAPPPH